VKKLGLLLGLYLSFLCVSSSALAKDELHLSVKAEVDKATFTIGEKVEYRVSVIHDPGIQILSPMPPPDEKIFQIKEAHDFSEKQGKQIVEGRRFIFTAYELGEYILEPVTLRYRTPSGEEKSIRTNKLYLTVRSVDASGKPMTDIRNAKGVLSLARQWGWLWSLLLILLLGGGGAFYWWQHKHRLLPRQETEEDRLSLEDQTLLRLNRLFDSDLLKKGKVKEYFLELSEILRRYFEKRFEILAVESTTAEVLKDLAQKEIAPGLLEKIQQELETADLVKFAKWKPAPAEIVKTNQLAKTIVEEARPQVGV